MLGGEVILTAETFSGSIWEANSSSDGILSNDRTRGGGGGDHIFAANLFAAESTGGVLRAKFLKYGGEIKK